MSVQRTHSTILGEATPTPVELDAIVSEIVAEPVNVDTWDAEAEDYESGSPATGALVRVRGTTTTRQTWSAFVKVLQHPRHWRLLHRVPAAVRPDFLTNFPWRAELGAWDPAFAAALPPGLRVPTLYRTVELDNDRVAIWMEDIVPSNTPWTLDTFELAATVLGTLAANRRDPAQLAVCPVPAGYGLRRYYDGAVTPVLPSLHDHELWRDPRVRAADGERLRTDLIHIAAHVPRILDQLDELPQAFPHGDASPQNLLTPAGEPNTLVAIDLAFQCPHAVGFDLAQLLIGLAHAGHVHPDQLPPIEATLPDAYAHGMTNGQHPATIDDIRTGYTGSLVVRAAFTSLPFHQPTTTLDDRFLDQRVALTRFVADRGIQLLAT